MPSVKDPRVTNIVKEIKLEGVWGVLESKTGFQRQSLTKYLRLTSFHLKNHTTGKV